MDLGECGAQCGKTSVSLWHNKQNHTNMTSDTISDGTQNVAADLRGALRELKEVLAGKKQLNTLESLLDEL